MAKTAKMAKMALLHAKNPENGQNRQKSTKNGVFGLPVGPTGVWLQRSAAVERFFWFPRFFGSKKAIFHIFWPACDMRNGPKWGEIPKMGAKKVTFFGKSCVQDLGVSNSEKWRFVHRTYLNNFWKSSNLHFFFFFGLVAGLPWEPAAGLSRIRDPPTESTDFRKNDQNRVKIEKKFTFQNGPKWIKVGFKWSKMAPKRIFGWFGPVFVAFWPVPPSPLGVSGVKGGPKWGQNGPKNGQKRPKSGKN